MERPPLHSPPGTSPTKTKHPLASSERKRPSLENLVATLHLKAHDAPLTTPNCHAITELLQNNVINTAKDVPTKSNNSVIYQNGHVDHNTPITPSKASLKTNCNEIYSSQITSSMTSPTNRSSQPSNYSSSNSSSSNFEDVSSKTQKSHSGLFLDSESSQDDLGLKVSNAVASILPQLGNGTDNGNPSQQADKIICNGNHPSIEFVNDEPRLSYSPCKELPDLKNPEIHEVESDAPLVDSSVSKNCNNSFSDSNMCQTDKVTSCSVPNACMEEFSKSNSSHVGSIGEIENGEGTSETTMSSSDNSSLVKETINGYSSSRGASSDKEDLVSETNENVANAFDPEIFTHEDEEKEAEDQIDLSIYTKPNVIASDLLNVECLERMLMQEHQSMNMCQIHKYANVATPQDYIKEQWKSVHAMSTSLCNIKFNPSTNNRCLLCSKFVVNLAAHTLQMHCCLTFVPVVETRSFFHHLAERSVEMQELYSEESYGTPIYICTECGCLGRSIGEARLHLNVHSSVYTMYIGNAECSCHLNLVKFLNPVNAVVHGLRNSLDCGYCSIRVSCLKNLKLHQKAVHQSDTELQSYKLPINQEPEEIRDQTCYSWIALDNFTNFLDGKLFRLYSVGSDKYSSLYSGSPIFPKVVIPDTIEVPAQFIQSPASGMSRYLNSKFRWKYTHTEIDKYIEQSFDCAVQIKFQDKFSIRRSKPAKIGRKPVALLAGCDLVQINSSTVKNDDGSCRRSKRISQAAVEPKSSRETTPELPRTRSGIKQEDGEEGSIPVDSEKVDIGPKAILSGEWGNEFTFVCCSCGNSYKSLADIMDHKWDDHPMVWCAHTMYRGTDIPEGFCKQYYPRGRSKVAEGSSPVNRAEMASKKKRLHTCSSCGTKLADLPLLHAHIVECGGLNRVVTHKKRNKKGSKFRRRTGQGIPSQRYLNLNGTPNKNSSNAGSGVSTPQNDPSLATSKTILNVKKKLELDAHPNKSIAPSRKDLKSHSQKARNLPRCGFKRRFRMRLRRKLSQLPETPTKRKNSAAKFKKRSNSKSLKPLPEVPVKLKSKKAVKESVCNVSDKSHLSFANRALRKSRASLIKLSSKVTGDSSKKTKKVHAKKPKTKVVLPKELSSDSDSTDDLPLNTLATRLVRAKFEPARRKAFMKSCKATSRNLATERRSSSDDPEASDETNTDASSHLARSLRKRTDSNKNIETETAKASPRQLPPSQEKSSTPKNKRKACNVPTTMSDPKRSKTIKESVKSAISKAKVFRQTVLKKKTIRNSSNSSKKSKILRRRSSNASDKDSSKFKEASSLVTPEDITSDHSIEVKALSSCGEPSAISQESTADEIIPDIKDPKTKAKNITRKRVHRKSSKNGLKQLKEGPKKTGANQSRRKNQLRKSTKSFGVSTLDNNDPASVPDNKVKGVRVLSYKSLNTASDLEKMVPTGEPLDADESLIKPKKLSETHKNNKRKYCESDENSPNESVITKSKKRSHSRKHSEDSGYLCTECGLTFDSISSREDHKLDCTNIALEMSLMVDDHLYECPYCHLTFAMKGTQKKHTSSCRAAKKVRRSCKSETKLNKKIKSQSEITIPPVEIVPESPKLEEDSNTSDLESIASRLRNLCLEKLGAPQICSILYSYSMPTSNLRLNLGDSSVIDDSTFIWMKFNDSSVNSSNDNYPILKMLLEQPVCAGLAQKLYEVMVEMKANSYIRTRDLEQSEDRLPPLVVNVSRPELLKALSNIEDFIKEAEHLDMSLKKEQMLKSMRRVFEDDTIS